MADSSTPCIICGPSLPRPTRETFVFGRMLILCRSHAAQITKAKPKCFEDVMALFRPAPNDTAEVDRRSPIARRSSEMLDRRMFPPRPEGRRRAHGRRATDPQD
jgi:hypothetical protein